MRERVLGTGDRKKLEASRIFNVTRRGNLLDTWGKKITMGMNIR